ncbi:MAG: hypothetical protein QM750_31235 [Rubrivivax sp.]
MRNDLPPQAQAAEREQVALALSHIERSAAFRPSARHRALLRHLVERALDGDLAALKESVIAVEVFGRAADRFDPRSDTIVRVEARRLRSRLADYYRVDGQASAVRISLPVGSYVPRIVHRAPPPAAAGATRRARDLCERGEHFLRQPLSIPTLRAALQRFDEAAALSPDFAPAQVGRGRAWLNLATGWYEPPAQAAQTAGAALDRALELQPGQPVALALRAAIHSQFARDWPRARQLFQQAAQLAPGEAFVHSAFGCHLRMHGEFAEAEAELALARQLDPQYLNTRSHMINLRIAQQRFDDAEAELEAFCDVSGPSIAALGLRGSLALYRGDAPAAVAHYEAACQALPEVPACSLALAAALAADGQVERADALCAGLAPRVEAGLVAPYLLAIFERWRGRPDAAFGWLERCLALRDPLAVQVPDEPSFNGLRADPRWEDLARRARQP